MDRSEPGGRREFQRSVFLLNPHFDREPIIHVERIEPSQVQAEPFCEVRKGAFPLRSPAHFGQSAAAGPGHVIHAFLGRDHLRPQLPLHAEDMPAGRGIQLPRKGRIEGIDPGEGEHGAAEAPLVRRLPVVEIGVGAGGHHHVESLARREDPGTPRSAPSHDDDILAQFISGDFPHPTIRRPLDARKSAIWFISQV